MMDFIIKLSTAFLFGLMIGLEREWHKCSAGMRTNVLVSIGSATFISLAVEIGGHSAERVASYIVSGVGFLGAGVILKDGASIRGLNTAATLWCTAAIGAFCGLGYLLQPLVCSIFIIISHLLLRTLSKKIRLLSPYKISEQEECHYQFITLCKEEQENHIRTLFIQYIGNNNNFMLKSISSTDSEMPHYVCINVEILSSARQDRSMEKVASFLTLENGIISLKWELKETGNF